jgi:putative ABC transport system substrate-binding protein
MNRRDVITLLGGAATWPRAAFAQQPTMPGIGFLSVGSREPSEFLMPPFRQGLREAGYVEGQNVMPELAADLVRRQVAMMVAIGGTVAFAAKAMTATIPIVFGTAADPVEVGLVASLNRPGGNLTGVTNLNAEVGPKRLELLHEMLPTATVFALLVDPHAPVPLDRLGQLRPIGLCARGLFLEDISAAGGDFDSAPCVARCSIAPP